MNLRVIAKRICRILPDKVYLNLKFFMNFGEFVNFQIRRLIMRNFNG